MRIAVVTESYLPQVNGVTNSVVRATSQLRARGHEILIVAPGRRSQSQQDVVRTASFGLPGYREVKVGVASSIVNEAIIDFRPDVLHLASPVALGASALRIAKDENVPAVAVYQTDLPRYAATYHLPFGRPAAWKWLRRLHNRADLTLAPTTPVATELHKRGFRRVRIWGRGVDTDLFQPGRFDADLRDSLVGDGSLLVGYVGRLSADKEVKHLCQLGDLAGIRLVVVGDGPARRWLERRLPRAHFSGFQSGPDLAALFATFDVLVHTSRYDTFGQVVQEALASGTPVVAPNAGGPVDLIADRHNGVFWPAGDPTRIKDIFEWLQQDREAVSHMAANARASVQHRTWSALVDELEGHYRSVSHVLRVAV